MKASNVARILELYPEFHTVYGPYIRKDGRKIVILYDGRKRSARQLAKVKLEVKLGRRLYWDEEVDHIDEDPTNDKFSNLQALTKSENASKSKFNGKGFSWATGYKQEDHVKRNGSKNGQAKLALGDAAYYRKLFKKGRITLSGMRKETGLNAKSIKHLVTGVTYIHEGGPICRLVPRNSVGRPGKGTKKLDPVPIWT